ncbi:hypothetical protein [Cohnella sp. AR92]|uniref:hypothetical protein n=1 Tax=Cohnella sp. AR92 TaxID=648716 RepID=UPI000F8CE392|nr:hypothetical protein [Cohnella sp. AR92]RUS44928.1 hypothetical protein ELR57_21980 [Cohnella sp. AR92]
MGDSKSNVIRGRFRLGEEAFPSSKEIRENIERELNQIFKKYEKDSKNEGMKEEIDRKKEYD